jgi:hypothetical protein
MRSMRHLPKCLLPLVLLILVEGCDRLPTSGVAKTSANQEPLVRDVERLESDVRIAAANKRIDELERKLGELEATPEKLDLDLLTSRVTALELNAGGAASTPATPLVKESPGASHISGGEPERAGDARKTSKRSSTLNLPELESRPRLVTPGEARDLAPKK